MNYHVGVDKKTFYKYNLFVTRCNNFVTNEKESCNMLKKLLKTLGLFTMCVTMMTAMPMVAHADEKTPEYQTSTSMIVRVEAAVCDVYSEPTAESGIVGQASKGSTYEILDLVDSEWVKVLIDQTEGYISTVEAAATVAETVEEVVVDADEAKRMEIVEYGKTFVGNRYIWGGMDPNKGADCSGFTMYIMKHVAGVDLSHSSRAQANEGREVSKDDMQPGDLVFYSSGKRINHVAIYAGDGMVVHAANEKDGIKMSPWNYRKPVKIVNVLGDLA